MKIAFDFIKKESFENNEMQTRNLSRILSLVMKRKKKIFFLLVSKYN